MDPTNDRARIAFVTTPKCRDTHSDQIEDFIQRYLHLVSSFSEILVTGGTYSFVMNMLDRLPSEAACGNPTASNLAGAHHLDLRQQFERTLVQMLPNLQGMIEIGYELVEGRLDAMIHLSDWEDISAKPDSAALRRQANVHNVPIASDIHSARAFVEAWISDIKSGCTLVRQKRLAAGDSPLTGIQPSDSVIAMVAHDNMKLELCRFAVRHATEIFDRFDFVLATGTTGKWLKRFMEAAGRTREEVDRIRCCLSGPYGGDLQIAYAVVKELCRKVIFLQDPLISHPHHSDISLFEQAVVAHTLKVELATNSRSAEFVLAS